MYLRLYTILFLSELWGRLEVGGSRDAHEGATQLGIG